MIQLVLHDQQQGHQALRDTAWPYAKAMLANGRPQVLEVRDYEDALHDAQRRFYHGYILAEIARQAAPGGQRFSLVAWKEYYRARFLGSKRRTSISKATGKVRVRHERVSSESLGVREYANFTEKVTAHAVTELGVEFDVARQEWVDPDTGEVMGI